MAHYKSTLPFDRGQIYADAPGATDAEPDLGQMYQLRDNISNTGRPEELVLVRNESGGTLLAGQAVKWVASRVGLAIAGHCDPGDNLFAGFVDDQYTISGVSIVSNAIFYLNTDGPSARFGDPGVGYFNIPSKLRSMGCCHGVYDQFNAFLEGAAWVTTKDGVGAQAMQALPNGILLLTTDTTTNNEVVMASPAAQFQIAQNKTIYWGARIKAQEGSTNLANLGIGLYSGAVASAIGNSGGGPPANYTGASFYKLAGGTVWNTATSIGTTQDLFATSVARDTSNYVTLNGIVYTTSATSATSKFYINGTLVRTYSFTYTGAAAMKFLVGVKTGYSGAETLFLDYAYCLQQI